MKKLKKILLVILMLVVVFIGYVFISTRNLNDMTFRQRVLKAVYPITMWFTKAAGKNTQAFSNNNDMAKESFYNLQSVLNNGDTLDFSSLQGKKVLIVNTASNCGYTHQYEGLQKLYEKNKENLTILAFPANDFKEQEKGSDEDIAAFCKLNYGITFPLMKKTGVIKNSEQNSVFNWLTDSTKNGWNNEPPTWNFTKFLINEKGELTNYFGPSVEPESEEVLTAINK